MLRTAVLASLLLPGAALARDTGDTGGLGSDFESEPRAVVFNGVGKALDTTYTLPLGFQLDVIIAEFWLGVIPKLTGNSEFGLYVEGTSDIVWSPDDNAPGLLYHGITPVEGSGLAAMKTDVAFKIDFALYSGGGGPVGNPTIAFPLFSEDVSFDLKGAPFTPFLLPEQSPNSSRINASSSDLAFTLPLVVPIGLGDIASINAGVIIRGEPRTTATYGGRELATRYLDFVIGRTGEIQMESSAPNAALLSQYTAYVDTNIAYQFNIDLTFELEIFGFSVFPIKLPLWGQAFPLFNSLVDLDFQTEEYIHPLPQLTFPDNIAATRTINLGEVEVGSSGFVEVSFFNDGELDLVGEMVLDQTGRAFSLTPDAFDMGPAGEDFTVVTFEPTLAGDFEATVEFRSNDPYTETYELKVLATAIEPVLDTGFAGGDKGGRQPTTPQLFQSCGCANSSPSGALIWLGLLPLLALRRRQD